MAIDLKLIDKMLVDYKSPEESIGKGLLKQFTKALLERAMQVEMNTHLGYEKHDPKGNNSGIAFWIALGPLSKIMALDISGSLLSEVSVVFNVSMLGAIMLAGAGIKTKLGFQQIKGMHGSMHYTLSMPVTRTRLLAVRVAVGLAEAPGLHLLMCSIFWSMIPACMPTHRTFSNMGLPRSLLLPCCI